jgi:serine/threonine-protein kinase
VGGSSSTLRDAAPVDASRALESAEHIAAVRRMRIALGPGWLLWMASIVFDIGNAAKLAPGSFPKLAVLRILGGLIALTVWLRSRSKRRPSTREFRVLSLGLFTSCSAIFGAMAVVASGVASPYFGGAMIVVVICGMVQNERWQRGAVAGLATFAAYPLVILGAAAFSPRIAAQLRDPVASTIFSANVGNLLIAAVVVIIAGDVAWRLRRQVFEARSLGRYKLKKRIGVGGMGEVWVAHHATLDRDVAVKILSGDWARRDATALARFEREVRATTELAHPNTVRVFDYGVTDDGVSYYAMELLDGESLASLIAREGALPPARAIHLVSQVARALAEAHAKGIVHRDVKPENIFVVRLAEEPDFVKVLDFGIAQRAETGLDPKLTRTGALIGTPAWLAPETIRGEVVDARADLYSLGAVLYCALAGKAPFDGANPVLVVNAHLHDRPPRPSEKLGKELPADVEAVVLRCLEKIPGARYPGARELAEALAACADAGKWTRSEAESAWARRVSSPGISLADTMADASAPKRGTR